MKNKKNSKTSVETKIHNCFEILDSIGLRYGQIFEIVKIKNGGDIFNLPNKSLLRTLEKIIEENC